MRRFVTVGYCDQAGYDRTAPAARKAALAHAAALRRRGVVMGVAGPPVQVRNPEGQGAAIVGGPYGAAPLPVAGFAVIEATDLAEAVRLAAGTPCAVAHGVVEVWPLMGA